MSTSKKVPQKQKPKSNTSATGFWHRCFASEYEPKTATLRCRAWHYCMAHYRKGSLGVGASEYGLQASFALVLAFCTGVRCARLYSGNHPEAIIWLAIALAAVVWLYASVHGICQIMAEATDFADNATMNVESQEEIPDFFDEFYPWMFYKK